MLRNEVKLKKIGITVREFLPAHALKMADYLADKLDEKIIPHFLAHQEAFWALAGDCIDGVEPGARETIGSSAMLAIVNAVFSDEVNPGFLLLVAALAATAVEATPESPPHPTCNAVTSS